MNVTRHKDLVYKRAEFLKSTGKTLQQHLEGAWQLLPHAAKRAQKMTADEDNIRLWNKRAKRGLLMCGMFHSWERGRSQLVIQLQDEVEEYPIMATEPPKVKGAKGTEFNEGLLFFGIYKNHALILQSSALRISAFDEYLNWLLQDATAEMEAENRVELLDALPRKFKQRDMPPLKSIVITPPLQSGTVAPAAQKADGIAVKGKSAFFGKSLTDLNWLRDVLEGLGAKIPKELLLDGDFNPERVHVDIRLSWRGRDKEREETPVLDTVMRAFRDIENPPIKAITATGTEIRGNELRLKKNVPIAVDGKIPLAGDVFEKMQAYMTELLDSGEIAAD